MFSNVPTLSCNVWTTAVGNFISLVMAAAVEQESRNGWLRAVSIQDEPPRKEIYLIRREGKSDDGTAAQFIDFVGGHAVEAFPTS
jgi:DNA-binding transcriptional LysR family regulator